MDETVFRVLYQNTAGALWAYIFRSCGNQSLADDILQETYYRFLRTSLPELNEPRLKAYLYRTASRLVADHWRRQEREKRWSPEDLRTTTVREKLELRTDMEDIFGKLKTQEQSLLWLAYVEGFDHREIARILSIKEKSVRVLLFRARQKLAAALKKLDLAVEGTS